MIGTRVRGPRPARRERSALRWLIPAFFAVSLVGVAWAANTIPNEVMLPGTQPEDNVAAFQFNCDNCHESTPNPEFEPWTGWQGSMMAHASRDPLFWATLAVAEQDFLPNATVEDRGGAGDLCLRCHVPGAWLQGNSVPTDGSGLAGDQDRGIECEFCHLLVDPDQPVNVTGTDEVQNTPFEAHDTSTGEGYYGTGQYVINGGGTRLGPYSDAAANHPFLQSAFHRSGNLCGTCHDVSNPVVGDLAHNNGAQVPLQPGEFSGVLGSNFTDKAAFKNPPHKFGVVERTFSEWLASGLDDRMVSSFPSLPADLQAPTGSIAISYDRAYNVSDLDNPNRPNYVDGTPRYFTCQTCHMSASTGLGCNRNGVPVRADLPRHDLTGSGYWVPEVIIYQDDQGTLRHGGGLDQLTRDAMADGMVRAEAMLQSAATLSANQVGNDVVVRVTNLTGHKLISGYPEGRRMWLNVRWFDGGDALIHEDGEYGQIRTLNFNSVDYPINSIIDPSSTKVYEADMGLDQQWASQLMGLGYDGGMVLDYDRLTDAPALTLGQLATSPAGTEGHSFHFVLNNVIIADNRIPPYLFDYDMAQERNALPVPATQYGNPGTGGTYDYWDDVSFAIPVGAVRAEVRLYYQQTSWEYIQFLWLQNDGLNTFLGQEGVNLLDAWLNAGSASNKEQSVPLEMAMASANVTAALPAPGEASKQDTPAEQMLAAYDSGTGMVDVSFTPACDATEHTIYYGDLANVSAYTYAGAACAVGSSGSASFDPGLANAFFVVVGNNGAVEGTYGTDGTDQRPEDVGTAVCDIPQDLSSTCN